MRDRSVSWIGTAAVGVLSLVAAQQPSGAVAQSDEFDLPPLEENSEDSIPARWDNGLPPSALDEEARESRMREEIAGCAGSPQAKTDCLVETAVTWAKSNPCEAAPDQAECLRLATKEALEICSEGEPGDGRTGCIMAVAESFGSGEACDSLDPAQRVACLSVDYGDQDKDQN